MPYGVEENTTGKGGLAAQAPPDLYYGQALGIVNTDPQIGQQRNAAGVQLPSLTLGGSIAAPSLTSIATPAAQQQPHWSSVLDFHGSVAPWILIALLVLVGWLHVSLKAHAGRRASAGLVL
jgi:hypothetical protein